MGIKGNKRNILEAGMKGSATIEMALILPMFFLIFFVIIYGTFYYHDKNVLKGVGHETVIHASEHLRMKSRQTKEMQKQEMEQAQVYFKEHIKGKLIFFSDAVMKGEYQEQNLEITASCKKKKLGLNVRTRIKVCTPEAYIRNVRGIKKAGEDFKGDWEKQNKGVEP